MLSSGIIVSNLQEVGHVHSDLSQTSSIESVFAERKEFYAYYVMPRFGRNLEVLHAEANQHFSAATILKIGANLLDIFRDIHAAGYTYNDLKMDNILVGDATFSKASQQSVRLVDFGFAEKFRCKDGSRKPQSDQQYFRGNMVFAAPSQF